MNLGKIAYEAYVQAAEKEGLTILFAWDILSVKSKRTWEAVGETVAQNIYSKAEELTNAARRGFESVQHKDKP